MSFGMKWGAPPPPPAKKKIEQIRKLLGESAMIDKLKKRADTMVTKTKAKVQKVHTKAKELRAKAERVGDKVKREVVSAHDTGRAVEPILYAPHLLKAVLPNRKKHESIEGRSNLGERCGLIGLFNAKALSEGVTPKQLAESILSGRHSLSESPMWARRAKTAGMLGEGSRPSSKELSQYTSYIKGQSKAAKTTQRRGRIGVGIGTTGWVAGRMLRRTHPRVGKALRGTGKALVVAGGLANMTGSSMKKYNKGRKLLHHHLSGEKLTPRQRMSLRMANPSGSLVHREIPAKYRKHALKAYASDKDIGGSA